MELWLHYRSILPIKWYQYRYEDLASNFDETTKSIFSFVGMGPPVDLDKFYVDARGKLINTPSYIDVTTPLYSRSTGRWNHYQELIAPHLPDLKPFIEEFGYWALSVSTTKLVGHTNISDTNVECSK